MAKKYLVVIEKVCTFATAFEKKAWVLLPPFMSIGVMVAHLTLDQPV